MTDVEQIQDLVARYADAVCRRDQEAWAATWAEDALWQLPGAPETRGRDNIVALWVGAMANFPFVAQLVYNSTVSVDGDSATGRMYITEQMTVADGSERSSIGVYQDRFVRTDGGWLFAERHYSILWNKVEGNSRGDLLPYPDLKF